MPTEFPFGFPGPDVVFRAAVMAEEAGFDALWVGDHILWHCPNLECLSSLAALTGVTKDIVLGSAVLLLPLRHPVHVAKIVATIDQLSRGRLAVGVCVGGENEIEFLATGSELSGRGLRTDDSMRTIRALLRGEPVQLGPGDSPIEILPPSVDPLGPPLLIGGRSKRALRRCADLGDGWISLFMSPVRFAESWDNVIDQANAKGRAREELLASILVFVMVDERLQAGRIASSWLTGQFGVDHDQLMRHAVVGSADFVVDSLGRFRDYGVEHLILYPMGEDPLNQIEVLAAKVLGAVEG